MAALLARASLLFRLSCGPSAEFAMPRYVYRELNPLPAAAARYTRWLKQLDRQFTEHTGYDARAKIVRKELRRLYPTSKNDSLLDISLDPRNITLEPEYYGDIDVERYNERKPLIYLWQMFDRSPLGLNQWLGFRLRAMLGRHIFQRLGANVKIFQNVEFSFGYNLVIEDDCVIHRNVLLDDRGGIILRRGTSVSDYASIYSHTHDLDDQADVTNKLTEIGPYARITYHATVLAGTRIGEDAMLGALALATKDVVPHAVSLGIPAKVKRMKDHDRRATEQSHTAKPKPSRIAPAKRTARLTGKYNNAPLRG
jgi:acetyltransferase-like isoleucine patch superfamily enzyme